MSATVTYFVSFFHAAIILYFLGFENTTYYIAIDLLIKYV